jgi:hypothetical protein
MNNSQQPQTLAQVTVRSRPRRAVTQPRITGSARLPAVGLILVLLLLVTFLHPWTRFQWAQLQDDAPAYEAFVEGFPSSAYSDAARERIRWLREDDVWQEALAVLAENQGNQIEYFRDYVRIYPDGKYLDQAKRQVTSLADERWLAIAGSRSMSELRDFKERYPESTQLAAAEARIQQLLDDWKWVREQDSLEYYRGFVARFPAHAQTPWMEKRIIDLEVEEIAAGDHGQMPQPQRLATGGNTAEVDIENQTEYELTVRYSGTASMKLIVPKHGRRRISLSPGTYRVTASAAAANVRDYYGKEAMRGGRYSYGFYITGEASSSLPPPSLPEIEESP